MVASLLSTFILLAYGVIGSCLRRRDFHKEGDDDLSLTALPPFLHVSLSGWTAFLQDCLHDVRDDP